MKEAPEANIYHPLNIKSKSNLEGEESRKKLCGLP